jgi:hypothetical protein
VVFDPGEGEVYYAMEETPIELWHVALCDVPRVNTDASERGIVALLPSPGEHMTSRDGRRVVAVSLCVLLLVSTVAVAQPKAVPVDGPHHFDRVCNASGYGPGTSALAIFIGCARLTHFMCGLTADLVLAEGLTNDRLQDCTREAKTEAAVAFERARRQAAKQAATVGLLKDTYAYWVTVMGDLSPHVDDVKTVYRNRRDQQKAGLEERLNRLELE